MLVSTAVKSVEINLLEEAYYVFINAVFFKTEDLISKRSEPIELESGSSVFCLGVFRIDVSTLRVGVCVHRKKDPCIKFL